jgi:predicted nucleic acid-binding protein
VPARPWRRIALADDRFLYVDSSALVKLVVAEPETEALARHVRRSGRRLATSRVAVVEVARAVRLANASIEGQSKARDLLDTTVLVDVSSTLLQAAAALASRTLRTLDAIHLASLELVDPAEVVVYDRRLAGAARELGYATVAPGADR